MRDAWLLCAEAIEAGMLPAARRYASTAWEGADPNRYEVLYVQRLQVRANPLLPRDWCYYRRASSGPVLLVNPGAAYFIHATAGFDFLTLEKAVRRRQLQPLSTALAAAIMSTLTVPDDASELFGR